MERELPYNVDIEDLLNEVLEYMEDRTDIIDSVLGPAPNKEMRFASEIRQALFQLQKPTIDNHANEFDNDPPILGGDPYQSHI